MTQCADRLGGKAILATLDDMNTPNSGVVRFVDEDQHPRQIDFLWTVAGLREVAGVPAHVLDSNGDRIATFMVIDPVMCLRSRAHNVTRLPGYKTAHALKQLRAAIVCVREYGRDLLAQGNARATNGVNGAVFSIARFGVGVDVFVDHNIDILDALITEPGLPEKFYSHRLPYATRAVTRAREKALAAKAHSESVRARSEGR